MNGTRENRPLLMDPVKRMNGNALKQMRATKRLKLATLNSHLLCGLCNGYYVEATAIVECLHRFCRSCIVKYLRTNNFCPICEVQIHEANPWSSLRPDKTIQDLVYKLVPGLYQDEMRRRRQFYSRMGGEVDVAEGEEGGFLPQGARFFSQDDSISLSLEYYSQEEDGDDEEEPSLKKLKHFNDKPKRYLQCPAAVTVRHLKKFVRIKYGIGLDCWVDIIYNDECLPENFSLIDVAYTFTWKRTSPMRFSYRIFSKAAIRAIKTQKIFQTSRVDEEGKKSKHPSTLEQQMQNEYLGNFNLNPTNSGFCKTQSYTKNKSYSNTYNNTNKSNSLHEKKHNKSEFFFKDTPESDDGSRDKLFPSSEDSNGSGLRIILEKEETLKENSEDSQESLLLEDKRRRKSDVPSFGEEAVDSFTAKKLLKNKHKSEEKRKLGENHGEKRKLGDSHGEKKKLGESHGEKRKLGESHGEKRKLGESHGEKRKLGESHGEKRRKSTGHAEEVKKNNLVTKRRKTIADEFSLKRENEEKFSVGNDDDESMGNLKNEALRKVFVTKEKPDNNKRKEGEVRRKKRKKSKHHEGDTKKRKSEVIPSSPSIMSFAKDALKLKVKLTPSKPVVNASKEETSKEVEEEKVKNEGPKSEESENKKATTDKERLLHLRAVRHKNILNKNNPKDYINTPPSLTISKIDSSEQQPVKSTLIESRPSLEIMLVSPSDNSKVKVDVSPEPPRNQNQNQKDKEKEKEVEPKGVETPPKEERRSAVVDSFGVLDLSEKSTRTKENSSSSPSPKESPETAERCRKSTHQSILQIAQTLVNRKLSPILPENHLREGRFEGVADSSTTAAAMRNLKTLSDTAVNILMAAQNKNFPSCGESPKRSFSSSITPPALKAIASLNSTKPSKDCENGAGLKIPVYPISRERPNPIPPVPNLHEIYPKGRGRLLPFSRASTPMIKPGQNQTVRQIPNPFVVLNRQVNQTVPVQKPSENGEEGCGKPKFNCIPPLQRIRTKSPVPKLEDLTDQNTDKNGSTDLKAVVPKTINNNTKTVQNGSECNFLGLKNGEEKKAQGNKLNCGTNSIRRIEHMAKNIESVAAGLTARAVSNAMVDAK